MKPEEMKSALSSEDYEKMSRSARSISNSKTREFLEEFKKANPLSMPNLRTVIKKGR